jgi:Fibronectin type III domain
MTTFLFLNAAGTVNIELDTDLIGLDSENLTVCQIRNNVAGTPSAAAQALLNTFDKNKHSKSIFKAYGVTNDLAVIAYEQNRARTQTAIGLAAPTSLDGTVNSATQVTITWVKSFAATGYVVERATNVGFTTGVVAFTVADVATLAVTGLTTATPYWFRVRAIAPNGVVSANSASITRTTS